ncbi:peptidoglycan recognition protein [Streptomyces ziwulingensis]|uniref:N-acetylmuramoyl-L-alanine amidase n=1 Tax=Streptomyces ziwulingensis TaxID=1045501 RepID=A0ABP9BYD8_9ACTN
MRGFLVSSIGVTCATALALPSAPPALAAASAPAAAAPRAALPAEGYVPGSTQSLPFGPSAGDRATGAPEPGLAPRDVRHFSLVGVVWDDPDTELHGSVQVRTRATGTGTWSDWRHLRTHDSEHGPDPDTPERTSGRVRGATAPLWVGDSDGVEVRVREAEREEGAAGDEGAGSAAGDEGAPSDEGAPGDEGGAAGVARAGGAERAVPPAALPGGLRLELVEPGRGAAPLDADEIPELSRAETENELLALGVGALTGQRPDQALRAKPHIGPRPGIVTRRGWGADEGLRERGFKYTKKVKAAFVHHSATGNNYRCAQVPSIIRGIYRYHVRSMGWRDVGYNFLIDRCGKIYEGRAGGVAKPVLGAHTRGFNSDSMGVVVLGTYGSKKPSAAAVKALSRLTAWKLGLYGMNPRGKTYLKSGGGNRYRKGRNVRLNVISGHRDGFATDCPGKQLYGKLGTARSTAARYQGR